jgi:aspartokinase
MDDILTHTLCKSLERDPVLRLGFSRGLVSSRNFAALVVKNNPELGFNVEAVRTAIRRNEEKLKTIGPDNGKVDLVFKDSKVHSRSGVIKIVFKKGDESLDLITKSFKAMEIYGGDTFHVIKGHGVLHILVDDYNLDRIKDIFRDRIIAVQDNLCEVTVSMPELSYSTPGLFAEIMQEVALNKINISEAFSCDTEISIYVKEDDALATFALIKKRIDRAKKDCKK